MGRGERVARVYIGTVLLVQALVAGASGYSDARALALQGVAGLAIMLPLTSTEPGVLLRGLTVVPALAVSILWAFHSAPLGSVVWIAWTLITAWLCLPAGHRSPMTFAERAHRPREAQ